MTKRIGAMAVLFLLAGSAAWAEQDFYGIRIKNEYWAKNLVLKTGLPADPADLKEGPVLSHDITAEASLREIPGGKIDFRVIVSNGTDKPISTSYEYRDFFVTTRNGLKYPLIDAQESPELEFIEPKSNVTFTPSFGNLNIRNKDVVMIECSFDLGKLKIFLFPWAEKSNLMKLTSPAPPSEPPKEAKHPAVEKSKHSEGPRKTFWEWFSGQKKGGASKKGLPPEPSKADAEKPAPVTESAEPQSASPARQNFSPKAPAQAPEPEAARTQASAPETRPPASKPGLEDAIKKFVYIPSDAVSTLAGKKEGFSEPPPPPRSEAHVISFDKDYSFITLDAGSLDGIQAGMRLNVLRNGKTIAQARVKKLRESAAAAAVIPESLKTDIQPGDQISVA